MSSYEQVAEFGSIDNDEIFELTQNIEENWSPSRFRSMSVGDLIYDTETDKTIICCGAGWDDYTGEENCNG